MGLHYVICSERIKILLRILYLTTVIIIKNLVSNILKLIYRVPHCDIHKHEAVNGSLTQMFSLSSLHVSSGLDWPDLPHFPVEAVKGAVHHFGKYTYPLSS